MNSAIIAIAVLVFQCSTSIEYLYFVGRFTSRVRDGGSALAAPNEMVNLRDFEDGTC